MCKEGGVKKNVENKGKKAEMEEAEMEEAVMEEAVMEEAVMEEVVIERTVMKEAVIGKEELWTPTDLIVFEGFDEAMGTVEFPKNEEEWELRARKKR
jgi:hypothetical protein